MAFAHGLVDLGVELISTGGTHQVLRAAGLAVRPVSEITGFPEVLSGRVKTLHPMVHAGLLAAPTPDHRAELESMGIGRIDLLAVNFYPFQETVARGAAFAESIEQIDIGGVTMLRAAAKNHQAVLAVCDPDDYPRVLAALRERDQQALRLELARKAFAYTAAYDAAIAAWLDPEPFPKRKIYVLEKHAELRYGENPHQSAALYRLEGERGPLFEAQVHGGLAMSYNNYGDAEAAWKLVNAFKQPACVAVKHQNPCGVGLAEAALPAYRKAYDADPVSIFGGVVAFNRTVDRATAAAIKPLFLEVLLAPSYEAEALSLLAGKKNLRILEVPSKPAADLLDAKRLQGGFLLQTADNPADKELQTVVGDEPSAQALQDLRFAWTVVKHTRSNAIVVATDGQTLGIGMGQTSRIAAARQALMQAADQAKGAVLASDAFFPFPDVVQLAAEHGIRAIIQPGGSKRDGESIAEARRAGMAMVFTGTRHFRH